jgi:hypothetical protein
MIGLDTADLMMIAGGVMGCDSGTALAQADIRAANDALAQAGVAARPGRRAGRGRIPPTPPRPRSP